MSPVPVDPRIAIIRKVLWDEPYIDISPVHDGDDYDRLATKIADALAAAEAVLTPPPAQSEISDEDLDAIEQWGAAVLEDSRFCGHPFTSYTDMLPTHSIRSQMMTLVAEIKRTRAAVVSPPDAEEQVGWC